MTPPVTPAVLVGQSYGERNREHVLRGQVVSIGRGPENGLRLLDREIAGRQAKIVRRRDRYLLDVVSGGAPTTLNGEAVAPGERSTLEEGDLIALGGFEFRFARSEAEVYARIRVTAGVHRGKVFRLARPLVRIGRAASNEIQFPDRSVSREHCLVGGSESGWWLEDLGATNPTAVNGEPVRGRVGLREGDLVALGRSRFRFRNLLPLSPFGAGDPVPGGGARWN